MLTTFLWALTVVAFVAFEIFVGAMLVLGLGNVGKAGN